jgi:ABC-type spermidine/putrescine transport system permease subunit II
MNAEAANDAGIDIPAGLAMLVRLHRRRLHALRRELWRVVVIEGSVVALCAGVGIAAWHVAGGRDEPMHSIMLTCAALNVATVALCLRNAARSIRETLAEARYVRAALRQIETHVKTPPADLTRCDSR